MTTWGDARHFKYFLPRLLELTVEHGDEFMDLGIVFGKLDYARFSSWPRSEQEAVNGFFAAYWNHQLACPVVGAMDMRMSIALSAIAKAVPSIQPFLDQWLATHTDNAKRHLAAFILQDADAVMKKGREDAMHEGAPDTQYREVAKWLQTTAVTAYLSDGEDPVLVGDAGYAWPQLQAIRAALTGRP